MSSFPALFSLPAAMNRTVNCQVLHILVLLLFLLLCWANPSGPFSSSSSSVRPSLLLFLLPMVLLQGKGGKGFFSFPVFSLLVLYGKRRKLLFIQSPPLPPPLRLMPGMETTKKRVLDIISTFLRQILECGRKGNKNSRNFSWLIRGGFGLIRSEGGGGGEREQKNGSLRVSR